MPWGIRSEADHGLVSHSSPKSLSRIAARVLGTVAAMTTTYIAVTHVHGAIGSLTAMVVRLLNLPWPMWIGNVANLLQILSAGVAIVLAWRSMRTGARGSDRTQGRG